MKRTLKIFIILFCSLAVSNYCKGQTNTYYGTGAGTGGTYNANFGYYSGNVLTTNGNYNAFVGYYAGKATTTGYYNFFGGSHSGYTNTTGYYNTFLGYKSGYTNSTGAANIFIGSLSGYMTSSGGGNTFLGCYSGNNNTTGSSNVYIGSNSAYYNTTGSLNVCIGYGSGQHIATGTGNVFIGSYSGQNAAVSNKLFIANSNTSTPLIYGVFDSSYVSVNGRMGIGTRNIDPSIALKVNGKIVAKEVSVTLSNFPDYVFKKDYKLMPLSELESYIQKWSHLPSVPAEKQVLEEGLQLAEMNKLLLQKVEELTLYIIDQDKKLGELEKKINK